MPPICPSHSSYLSQLKGSFRGLPGKKDSPPAPTGRPLLPLRSSPWFQPLVRVSVSPSRARGLSLRSSYRLDICLQQPAHAQRCTKMWNHHGFREKETKPRGLRQPAQVGGVRRAQSQAPRRPRPAPPRRQGARCPSRRAAPGTPRRPAGAALPAAPATVAALQGPLLPPARLTHPHPGRLPDSAVVGPARRPLLDGRGHAYRDETSLPPE